jgi:hypothetical protein
MFVLAYLQKAAALVRRIRRFTLFATASSVRFAATHRSPADVEIHCGPGMVKGSGAEMEMTCYV